MSQCSTHINSLCVSKVVVVGQGKIVEPTILASRPPIYLRDLSNM